MAILLPYIQIRTYQIACAAGFVDDDDVMCVYKTKNKYIVGNIRKEYYISTQDRHYYYFRYISTGK